MRGLLQLRMTILRLDRRHIGKLRRVQDCLIGCTHISVGRAKASWSSSQWVTDAYAQWCMEMADSVACDLGDEGVASRVGETCWRPMQGERYPARSRAGGVTAGAGQAPVESAAVALCEERTLARDGFEVYTRVTGSGVACAEERAVGAAEQVVDLRGAKRPPGGTPSNRGRWHTAARTGARASCASVHEGMLETVTWPSVTRTTSSGPSVCRANGCRVVADRRASAGSSTAQ